MFFVFHIFTMSIREGCNSFVPTLEIGKLRLKVAFFFPKGPNTKIYSLTNPFQLKRYNKKHHFCWRPTVIFGQRNVASDFLLWRKRGVIILPTSTMHCYLGKSINITTYLHCLIPPQNGSHWMTPVKMARTKDPGKPWVKRPPTLQQPLCQTGQPLCQMAKEMMGWRGQQEPNHRCLSA